MAYKHADLIRRTYRDAVAHRHMVAVGRFHRIPASPHFRATADYVVAQLVMAGVQVAVRRYPADCDRPFLVNAQLPGMDLR